MAQPLPPDINAQLIALEDELREGDITEKGYLKKRALILSYLANSPSPDMRLSHRDEYPYNDSRRTSLSDRHYTMLSDHQFADFSGPGHRYSRAGSESNEPLTRSNTVYSHAPSTTLKYEAASQMKPLEPRGISKEVRDPLNFNKKMSQFQNMIHVLHYRALEFAKKTAFVYLDSRGKDDSSITFDKLYSRAEKVYQMIKGKTSIKQEDRVALVYREEEMVEFVIAFFGCLMAGVVAVPITQIQDYDDLNFITKNSQCHLVLTSDVIMKTLQRDAAEGKWVWSKNVEWWKTNEFGPPNSKKHIDPTGLKLPDIAYIEFSKSPMGDIKGVVLSHRTIMHQMSALTATISSYNDIEDLYVEETDGKGIDITPNESTFLSYLDFRCAMGLILGIFQGIYSGNTVYFGPTTIVTTPGLFANVMSRTRAAFILADYPGLKTVAFNYQTAPMITRNFSRKTSVNFSSVKVCFIDCLTVEPDFHDILGDRWLKPLGCKRGKDIISPILCLPEHGGMAISLRDYFPPLKEYDGDFGAKLQMLLDKESLKRNSIVIVATGEEAIKHSKDPATALVGGFGLPLLDATVALVDPDTGILSNSNAVGEIWVDSPSLSGGLWAMPDSSQAIFHAAPRYLTNSNAHPVVLEQEFVRTGMLGCIINDTIIILGMYEDRLRQRVEPTDRRVPENSEYLYHYTNHLVLSVMMSVPRVFDCSAFDIMVNEEYLPVVILESTAAVSTPLPGSSVTKPLDTALLDAICERAMEVLLEEHQVRVYCILITVPNILPRILRNGRKDIGNMLCRRNFEAGSLPSVHVKFGVERAVIQMAYGADISGGIFTAIATKDRCKDLPVDFQYSGLDNRNVVVDDRTEQPLTNFRTIVDLFQWRVSKQHDEPVYCLVDPKSRDAKSITWRKFDLKIASVAAYLKNKLKLVKGDSVVLLYTHSVDFVIAMHACFCLGIIAFPLAPLDPNRLNEDVPALLQVVCDFRIKYILMNHEVETAMKSKTISLHVRQAAAVSNVKLPSLISTSKTPKQNQGCKEMGFFLHESWLRERLAAVVWLFWTPDHRRLAYSVDHESLLGMCKIQKETCQMTSLRPLLGCVRSTSGMGFIHTIVLGIYCGAVTYLLSPVDFAMSPSTLFQTLSRYKVKDTYATTQLLDHSLAAIKAKNFNLSELENLMTVFEGRPRIDLFSRLVQQFSPLGLSRTTMASVYSHPMNPFITTRSYMSFDPVEICLDRKQLRRGRVLICTPSQEHRLLAIQDSGMVPICTQIAVVNPESKYLCRIGEIGEIWVASDGSVSSCYLSKDSIDYERFDAKISDGDPHLSYIRTGDIGFLLSMSRPIGPNQAIIEMQTLFVLGSIGESFDVNGLLHFPMDIEISIEESHKHISRGGSVIFQTNSCVVAVIEVLRSSFLSNLVPVVVNTVLEEHQFVLNTVVFVKRGDFPRSRLGEKQRGKLLGLYVSGRLRTAGIFDVKSGNDVESPRSLTPTSKSSISRRHESSARYDMETKDEYGDIYYEQEPDLQLDNTPSLSSISNLRYEELNVVDP